MLCAEHSGIKTEIENISGQVKEIKDEVKGLSKKMHIWIGVIACLTALPALIRVWQYLEPVAKAATQ